MSVRSANPLALVAAVRDELRRADVEPREIRRFSNEALAHRDGQRIREICREWVEVK